MRTFLNILLTISVAILALPAMGYERRYTGDGDVIRWRDPVLHLTLDPSLEALGDMDEVGKLDLRTVLAHELGHFLGLAHSDVQDAVMYPMTHVGDTFDDALHNDDVAGVDEAYAAPKEPNASKSAEPIPHVTSNTSSSFTPRNFPGHGLSIHLCREHSSQPLWCSPGFR